MSGLGSSGSTEVDPTLAYFRELFGRLGIDWCVAGAIAANAYRAPRGTTDLDLVVHIPAARYTATVTALKADGWRTFRVSPDSDYPDIVRMEHDRYFPTDLLLVKTSYQADALRRAPTVASSGVSFRVLAAEDVIVHKLIAYRHRDRADIVEILRSGTPLDRSYVERLATEWEVLPRWHEMLAESAG